MAASENEPGRGDSDQRLERGMELMVHLNLPWMRELRHDTYWVRHNKRLGSETPLLDEVAREEAPLSFNDLARVDHDVVQATERVGRALSEVIYALAGLEEAKDDFYKTFEDVKHREAKVGQLDMSGMDSFEQ